MLWDAWVPHGHWPQCPHASAARRTPSTPLCLGQTYDSLPNPEIRARCWYWWAAFYITQQQNRKIVTTAVADKASPLPRCTRAPLPPNCHGARPRQAHLPTCLLTAQLPPCQPGCSSRAVFPPLINSSWDFRPHESWQIPSHIPVSSLPHKHSLQLRWQRGFSIWEVPAEVTDGASNLLQYRLATGVLVTSNTVLYL